MKPHINLSLKMLSVLTAATILSSCSSTAHRVGTILSFVRNGPILGIEPDEASSKKIAGRAETIELASIPFWVAPKVGKGDAEYKGHGPRTHCDVRLSIRNGAVWARVYMNAKETRKDYTEVAGSQDFKVYGGPRRIVGFAQSQDTYTGYDYTDTDHAEDEFNLPEGEAVRRFRFVGDTDGREAGVRTGVAIEFNPIDVITE